MARKLIGACLGVLLFVSPAVAQDVPPESIPIDISEYLTDPLWAGECDPEIVVTPSGDVQMTLCPDHLSPSDPSPPVAPPAPAPAAPLPRLMSPFPIVRLAGTVTHVGTRIHLLQVRAPKGARALIRCRGHGCPIRHVEKIIRGRPLRVAAAERLVPAGAVLEVIVHGGDRIGKFTRFRFRQNRRPLRRDGCLWPGATRMAPCPTG